MNKVGVAAKGAFTRDREGKTQIHPHQRQMSKHSKDTARTEPKDTTADADLHLRTQLEQSNNTAAF